MLSVLYIREQLYLEPHTVHNTNSLPHLQSFIRLFVRPSTPYDKPFSRHHHHSFEVSVAGSGTLLLASIVAIFKTSSPRPTTRSRYLQHVWLYAIRLAYVWPLLDLNESALRFPLGSTQLSLPPDLPDFDRTTLHLSDMPSRFRRSRDYRNGSRPLGLQSAHSKSCRRQLCDPWTMGECTIDVQRMGRCSGPNL